jgi:Asp-tRNA(Asn)/Glu-tRNA(Gln) amidotransferase C subunit
MASQTARDEFDDINVAAVAGLARLARLNVAPDRLPQLTARLRELFEMARGIDSIDLSDVEPTATYDPSWGGEGAA